LRCIEQIWKETPPQHFGGDGFFTGSKFLSKLLNSSKTHRALCQPGWLLKVGILDEVVGVTDLTPWSLDRYKYFLLGRVLGWWVRWDRRWGYVTTIRRLPETREWRLRMMR
jgi:hypothetical protein